MSTRKITGIICSVRNIVNKKLRRISKKNLKRVLALVGVVAIMPIAAKAQNNPAPTEPLSSDQSKKLAENLAKLSPTADKKAEPIKMEVAPDPQPAPPAEEPQPEPAPAPAPVRVVKKTTRKVATSRKASRGKNVVGSSYEQCVPFARELSGVQIRGYAGNIQPNSSEASVGSVALFAGYGHAAVVTGIDGDSVTIKEANYVPGKITERTVPKSQLRGYVK